MQHQLLCEQQMWMQHQSKITAKNLALPVTTCESPICALSILQEQTEQFDLLLTELHMSEMSGLELSKIVDKELRIPIILMSAKAEVDVMIKGIQHGACYFLQKPISISFIKNLMNLVACKKISQDLEAKMSRRNIGKQNAPQIGNTTALNDQVGKEQCSEKNIVRKSNVGSDHHSPKKNKRKQVKWQEDNSSVSKKHLTNWTPHLHENFSKDAIQIRTEEAICNKTTKMMNAEGTERHHVASPHQKSCIQFSQEKEELAPYHFWNQFNRTTYSLHQPGSTCMNSKSMSNAITNPELIGPQPYQRAPSLGVVANNITIVQGNTPWCGREVLGSSGGTVQLQQLAGFGQRFYNNNVFPNTVSADPNTMQNTWKGGSLLPPNFTALKSNHNVAAGLASFRPIGTEYSQRNKNFGKECYGNQEVGSSSKVVRDDVFDKILRDLLEEDN